MFWKDWQEVVISTSILKLLQAWKGARIRGGVRQRVTWFRIVSDKPCGGWETGYSVMMIKNTWGILDFCFWACFSWRTRFFWGVDFLEEFRLLGASEYSLSSFVLGFYVQVMFFGSARLCIHRLYLDAASFWHLLKFLFINIYFKKKRHLGGMMSQQCSNSCSTVSEIVPR